MTTFAHIGGGIAIAAAVQRYGLEKKIEPSTIIAGAFLGLLPDLDAVFALLFGVWSPGTEQLSHHHYFTHTPLFYLLLSFVIWKVFGRKLALMFFAITLSHLVMDSWSTDDGIMWIWPLNDSQFSLFPMDTHAGGIYGLQFYIQYLQNPRLIIPEMIIVAFGVFIIIRYGYQRYYLRS